VAGILLIVAGIYALHLKAFDRGALLAPLRALRHERASQLALLVGAVIATYSVIDKVGVGLVNPFLYIYVDFFVSAVALAPYMLLARGTAVRAEWRVNRARIVAAGAMFIVAYLLVLYTLTFTQVAYTSSIREMAIVFGAVMGNVILHEPFGRMKVVGALLIFAGILAIAVAA
jgi:drug/metabolite transporter (DMT)-like permease